MALSDEEKRKRQRAAVKKYRHEKREQFRALARAAAKARRKRMPEKCRVESSVWRLRDPRNMMLTKAKVRARVAGVPFTLTLADIPIPARCPLLGIALAVATGGKVSAGSPSVDRLRPELGYVPGNVWVISHRANALKSNLTLEDWERFVAALRQRMLASG